jgi:hypothetical protein
LLCPYDALTIVPKDILNTEKTSCPMEVGLFKIRRKFAQVTIREKTICERISNGDTREIR